LLSAEATLRSDQYFNNAPIYTRSRLPEIPIHYFFFPTRTFAHRARCAAAIFLRAAADMVRFAAAEPVTVFAGCDPF